MSSLLDFAVITIFARETLEGGIIIGEYRTVILRSNWDGGRTTQQEALRAVTVAAVGAALLALVVCAAISIPLAVLSRDFNDKTAILIEGVSKIVAAICILGLSLKMPKFFGLYYSKSQVEKMRKGESLDEGSAQELLSLRSIRFNVAWNIWREVAECGVFLIPFFLKGEDIKAIPLSAVVGVVVGGVVCLGIYYVNQRMTKPVGLSVFTVGLLLLLSTGLFSGGCHKFEMVYGYTPTVWRLEGDFWSVDRLPMTIFKPFGYNDERTVLELVTFWCWMFFGLFLHYRKYKLCRKLPQVADEEVRDPEDPAPQTDRNSSPEASTLDDDSHDQSTVDIAGDVEVETSS